LKVDLHETPKVCRSGDAMDARVTAPSGGRRGEIDVRTAENSPGAALSALAHSLLQVSRMHDAPDSPLRRRLNSAHQRQEATQDDVL
jgi:hypothetical protein